MRIVFDTNILQRDTTLTGNSLRVFAEGHGKAGHSWYLPRVVYDELLANHRRSLAEGKVAMQGALDKFANKTGHKLPNPITDAEIEKLVGEYHNKLDAQLKNSGAILLEYPNVSHAKMAQREMQRKKPTKDTGDGYRDGLIWETILELATVPGADPIVFVTANSKDFAGGDSALHSDLQADLIEIGLQSDYVALVADIDTVIAQYVTPTLEILSGIAAQLKDGSYQGLNLSSYVKDDLIDELGADTFDSKSLGLPSEFRDIELGEVVEVYGINSIQVRRLNLGNLVVNFSSQCRCRFLVVFPGSVLDVITEEAKRSITTTAIIEDNSLGNVILDVDFTISLIYAQATESVLSVEVVHVQPIDTKKWLVPNPESVIERGANSYSIGDLVVALMPERQRELLNEQLNAMVVKAGETWSAIILEALRKQIVETWGLRVTEGASPQIDLTTLKLDLPQDLSNKRPSYIEPSSTQESATSDEDGSSS